MQTIQQVVKTGKGLNLAFAVIVMASYFATFSSLQQANLLDIALLIVLGITYIAIGIYGFEYCLKKPSLMLRLGYFVVQIPLGGVIVYLTHGAGFNALLLLPLAGHSVVLLSTYWVQAANIITMLVYVASVYAFSNNWTNVWTGLPIFLAGEVFIVVFTQMAVNEERAHGEVARLVSELEEANQRLREYALQIEELAIAKERNRLAREIHDGLGHFLTTIFMQIQAAQAVFDRDPKRAKDAMITAQNLTQEALVEIRRSVASLRDVSPGETLPLPERIEKMIKNYETSELKPEMTILGSPRDLSAQAQLTIFRSAQEGLNNACKHARASKIWVSLNFQDENLVRLTVHDNGVGAEHTDGGFGLLGLQERVKLLDGTFQITTVPGQGFLLEVAVPG
ncbi:MAG TPA: sensor histidine kinase [Anaerolineaceae bacterium]|nr:sensor histidine kinase [Anaerolineaceae bacterium]